MKNLFSPISSIQLKQNTWSFRISSIIGVFILFMTQNINGQTYVEFTLHGHVHSVAQSPDEPGNENEIYGNLSICICKGRQKIKELTLISASESNPKIVPFNFNLDKKLDLKYERSEFNELWFFVKANLAEDDTFGDSKFGFASGCSDGNVGHSNLFLSSNKPGSNMELTTNVGDKLYTNWYISEKEIIKPAQRPTISEVMSISSNDVMHFSFRKDMKVTSGSSDNLTSKRASYKFKLASGKTMNDLIAISSNNTMHFAWYKDGTVSAGVSNNLASKRKPYRFKLASGKTLNDLIAISSNNTMHFAWYKDGTVSAGVSNDLASKRKPYKFKLASGKTLNDLITISSNEVMHFAWYKDSTVSAGVSNDLASKRAPYRTNSVVPEF